MIDIILIINAGSSTIKFSVFNFLNLNLIYRGIVENLQEMPTLKIFNDKQVQLTIQNINKNDYSAAINAIFVWLKTNSNNLNLIAAGHRIVHGGRELSPAVLINDAVIAKITELNSLAPMHQPHNLAAVKLINTIYPNLLQIACFDTSFHSTQYKLAKLFAIPKNLTAEGIIRYGFHGISYEYIASVLPKYLDRKADKKVIVAHLGHGASMCALLNRKSIATSMGFTALDGLMMGERCGNIDPGVILYLIQEKKLSVDEVSKILYQQSGLLGVSGISSDLRTLLNSKSAEAIEAIELFCFIAAKELAALCGILQGCDAIVFTAGIGENSSIIRKKICDRLKWLGVHLNEDANCANANIISHTKSKIAVAIINTNEEYMIAKHTKKIALAIVLPSLHQKEKVQKHESENGETKSKAKK